MFITVPRARIDWSANESTGVFSKVILPASDEFSKPLVLKVKSDSALGSVGSDVAMKLKLNAYVDERPYTDKSTGQRRIFREQKAFFDVIQFGPVQTK